MKFEELTNKLKEIKDMGYVESLRSGSTGIGYTFEVLFGIQENNIPIPDIGGRVEVKTLRRNSESLITLFTFNRGVWHISQIELIRRYGYLDQKGRLALKNTLFYNKPIPQGLGLEVDEDKNTIHLIDVHTRQILGTWDIYVIVGKFMTKLSRLLIVMAERKLEGGKEFFHYNEAYLLSDAGSRNFLRLFKESVIGIDLRMHLKQEGGIRNRGTAFRIKEKYLLDLYENKRKIL